MARASMDVAAAGLLAAALAACAPAFAQQEPQQQLRPPPPYEREYQTFCRDRPASCAGGYGQARDEFLIKRQDGAMDTIRRREQELLNAPPPQRR